jgi:eukaryotic-like serine/threonine-protein kinase
VRIYGLPTPVPRAAHVSREPVEYAVSAYLDELRSGHRPSIEVYLARFPRHAAQLRELLPLVGSLESWKTSREMQSARAALNEALPFERLGDYRILREIGRGGMGVVYEGVSDRDGARVAVKILPGKFSEQSRCRRDFEQEARMASFLSHRHIIPVLDYGEHEGWSYYVMPLVEGIGLDRVVRLLRAAPGEVFACDIVRLFHAGPASDGSPGSQSMPDSPRVLRRDSWRRIAKIGIQVASALEYAHARGTWHRDIKPANLLLASTGAVWVGDFGMAIPSAAVTEGRDVAFGGTLPYLAPELLAGRTDARSDIYSLGATLYELCTLKRPYSEDDGEVTVERIRARPLVRARALNPRIPRQLERIIQKAMQRDPSKRYQSAGDLRAPLREFVRATGPSGHPPGKGPG